MSMKKIEEIRNMKVEELITSAEDLRVEISEMKRRIHLGEVQNPKILRQKRRELARVLTILSEHLAKERA